MKFWQATLAGLVTLSGVGAQPVPTISERGILRVGETTWATQFNNERWQPTRQEGAFKVESRDGLRFAGQFFDKGAVPLFNYTSTFTRRSQDSYALTCRVTNPDGVHANLLTYQGMLPVSLLAGGVVHLDDEILTLPVTYTGEPNLAVRYVKKLAVPTRTGTLTLSGGFTAMVVDGRKYGNPKFFVQCFYDPNKGDIRDSSFRANLDFTPYTFDPVSLAAVANRTFDDAVAGDGRGGWTDQGPTQDLGAFSANSPLAGCATFTIPRQGNTVLALSREKTRAPLSAAQMDVSPGDTAPRWLYLLHASAYTWGDVGRIIVQYRDGSTQEIDIRAARDVGNWWNPVPAPNAAVVWSQSNAHANAGLYESRFALNGKAVQSLRFEAVSDPTWLIVGATFSPDEVPLPQPDSFTLAPDPNWAPLATPMDVQPGSALDFSAWTAAPAGTEGRVIVTPDGHFAFADAPDQPVRFFGANLNFSANFLPPEEADAIALRLRQMGYNAVRIHHYDVLLAGGWNTTRYQIDEQMRDRLDYLFYAFKQQGLYITTDLFTIRRIRNPELAEFDGNDAGVFKALIPISDAAMNEWKRFAREVLTHRNPYTGITWAEDPALFAICPVNEDTLWAFIRSDAKVRALYLKGFESWLRNNPREVGSEAARNAAINEYIASRQMAADAEMKRFLREDVGCEALLTGNNWKDYYAQTPIRSQYDYVDNHGYWDHPSFPQGPWRYPFSIAQRNATESLAKLPRQLFLTRIEGIPFTVTEFNYVYPNRFRGEGGALFGAYSALQGFDGIFRFAWAHDADIAVSQQPALGMDIAQDPIGLLSEHMIGMLWRRGDLPAFEHEAVFVVNDELAYADNDKAVAAPSAEDTAYRNLAASDKSFAKVPPSIDEDYSLLGLTTRIASRYEPDANLASANAEFYAQKPQPRYEAQSGDGLVKLESAGNFLVKTPFSEALVYKSDSLDEIFVRDVTGGPATFFVGSLDGQPLDTSNRLLVLHLTDVLCEGIRFSEQGHYTIQAPGTAEKLVRRGKATVSIPNQAREAKVYALDLSGQRIAEVPFTLAEDGRLTFDVETIPAGAPTRLAYEIIR